MAQVLLNVPALSPPMGEGTEPSARPREAVSALFLVSVLPDFTASSPSHCLESNWVLKCKKVRPHGVLVLTEFTSKTISQDQIVHSTLPKIYAKSDPCVSTLTCALVGKRAENLWPVNFSRFWTVWMKRWFTKEKTHRKRWTNSSLWGTHNRTENRVLFFNKNTTFNTENLSYRG